MIKIPKDYLDNPDVMRYVDGIVALANMCWRYSASALIWRTWLVDIVRRGYTLEQGLGLSPTPPNLAGIDEESEEQPRQINRVANAMDLEEVWLKIGGFSLSAELETWREGPGMYGYVVTKNRLEAFESLAKKMFPIETHIPCAAETVFIDFPDEINEDTATAFAIELMEKNGVIEAYKALVAGVPLADICANRG